MTGDSSTLDELWGALTALRAGIVKLRHELGSQVAKHAAGEAKHAQEPSLPAMAAVRAASDELEGLVADDLWPLPTYQEMLYIL